MEGFFVLDSKDDIIVGDKPNVERMSKNFTRSPGRKRLADISNMPLRPSNLTQDIEQLQKENTALVKLLAERNRIIELTGAELHKLRVTLQKMQQQNLQLAQSNSQLLAELNSGKDKQKALQHELGSMNGLLIAKKLELEKENISEHMETRVCAVADSHDDNPCTTSRTNKSKSLGPSVKNVHDNCIGEDGRPRTRRQSARFKHDEPKPIEDFSEINNFYLPICSLPDYKMQENDSNSVILPVKKNNEEGDSLPEYKAEERRSSISRPSRQAAKKVQSYKEHKINVKMRRIE